MIEECNPYYGASKYWQLFELLKEEDIPETDIDALQYLIDYGSDESSNICDVIDSLLEYQKGLTINNTYYDWDEIKHLFGLMEDKE